LVKITNKLKGAPPGSTSGCFKNSTQTPNAYAGNRLLIKKVFIQLFLLIKKIVFYQVVDLKIDTASKVIEQMESEGLCHPDWFRDPEERDAKWRKYLAQVRKKLLANVDN
jgi:hypothetical protein